MSLIYLMEVSLVEFVIYGIPNTIFWTIWTNYFWNIIGYQTLYLYILCKYLRIKFNNVNQELIQMKSGIRFIRIRHTIHTLDALYREINEYNSTYWSKFLFIVWLTYGTTIVFLSMVLLFSELHLLPFLCVVYILTVFCVSFVFLITTSASVNSCANKAYTLLNSNLVIHKINFKTRKTSIKYFIKVFFVKCSIQFSYYFLPNFYKLTNIMERIAKKNMGFSCWTLFTIDYFRCYGVIILI